MEYAKQDQALYGVPNGVLYQHNDRVDELNERMVNRYFPDVPLPAHFSPRPTPTKQTVFGINPYKNLVTVPIQHAISHRPEINFNPATQRGPASDFLAMIDTESMLRDQSHPLTRENNHTYIPTPTGDLYKVNVISRHVNQPFLHLQPNLSYSTYISPHILNIKQDKFNNNTRLQSSPLIK
jgi:hypothetical protein